MDNKILLTTNEQHDLYDALHYMTMTELKKTCFALHLAEKGKKVELIERIMHFIKTGKHLASKKMPLVSQAKNHPAQSLHENSLMLYGSYKNDAQTRAFFKKLIGPHFHFTAFGIDWLNERWYAGNPPTYHEFTEYWQQETNRRKKEPAQPKREWALINFVQRAKHDMPHATQKEVMVAWKKFRQEKVNIVEQLLKKK